MGCYEAYDLVQLLPEYKGKPIEEIGCLPNVLMQVSKKAGEPIGYIPCDDFVWCEVCWLQDVEISETAKQKLEEYVNAGS